MFKILVEIDGELENIDDQCTDELKFEDIGQKVFSFKHKAHNWLREVEKQDKLGRSSKVAQCQVPKLQLFQIIKKVINQKNGSC